MTSSHLTLRFGVSQGSILGTFLLPGHLLPGHLLPLSDILNTFNVNYYTYANDCQIYLVIDSSRDLWINKVDDIIPKVSTWFSSIDLKQIDDETEFMFVFIRNSFHSIPENVLIQGNELSLTTHIKSLGFILDDNLTYEKQVNSVCSSCNYQLRRIYSVQKYLSFNCSHDLCVHYYFQDLIIATHSIFPSWFSSSEITATPKPRRPSSVPFITSITYYSCE